MRKRWAVLMAGAVVLVLVIAGCGGGDSSTGSSAAGTESSATEASSGAGGGEGTTAAANGGAAGAEPPTIAKAAFIKEANAICAAHRKKTAAELQAFFEDLTDNASETHEAEVTVLVPLLVSGVQAQLTDIRALGLPRGNGDEEHADAILTAYQAWVEEAEANPQKIIQTNDIYDRARELANSYGLFACAKGPFEELGF